MQKHFLKFGKVFTNVACTPLILMSNNSELAAKYLSKEVDQSITNSPSESGNLIFTEDIMPSETFNVTTPSSEILSGPLILAKE